MPNGQRRINKRFVATFTIVTMLVLTVIIAVLMRASARRDPEIFAQRAEILMARGKYIDAASAYLKALHHSGQDPKWLIPAADAYFKADEFGRALGALQRAVIIDETFVEGQE